MFKEGGDREEEGGYPTIEQPLAPHHSAQQRGQNRVQGKHSYFNVDPLFRLPGRESILAKDTLAPLPEAQGGGKLGKEAILSQVGIVLQPFVSRLAGDPCPRTARTSTASATQATT
ncbi:hypothetical protein V8E36_000215 [Tilletia maclaganii]